MVHARTAAPCEVCGKRVSHHGPNRGFAVGISPKGVKRLVHDACGSEWDKRKHSISDRWPELRPEVLLTLPLWIRNRIQRLCSCLLRKK